MFGCGMFGNVVAKKFEGQALVHWLLRGINRREQLRLVGLWQIQEY